MVNTGNGATLDQDKAKKNSGQTIKNDKLNPSEGGKEFKTTEKADYYTFGAATTVAGRGNDSEAAHTVRDIYVRASVASSTVSGANNDVLLEFVDYNGHNVLWSRIVKQGDKGIVIPVLKAASGLQYEFGVLSYHDNVLTVDSMSGNYVVYGTVDPVSIRSIYNGTEAELGNSGDIYIGFTVPTLSTHTTTHEFYNQKGELVKSEEYEDVARPGDTLTTIDKHNTNNFAVPGVLFDSIENGPTVQVGQEYIIGNRVRFTNYHWTNDYSHTANPGVYPDYYLRRYITYTETDGTGYIEIAIYVPSLDTETVIYRTPNPLKPGAYNESTKNGVENPAYPVSTAHFHTGDVLTAEEAVGYYTTNGSATNGGWFLPSIGVNIDIRNPSAKVENNTLIKYTLSDVKVNYVSTDGITIKESVYDTKDKLGGRGTTYNTAEDNKPATITYNGKTYKLVVQNNGVQAGSADESGELPYNQVLNVTYVYELVKGDVFVHYENEDGEVIKDSVEAKKDTPTGDPYDTTSKELKPDEIKTPDGKTYEYKKVKEDSDPEKGEVKEDPTNVTYVYKEVKGSVVVNYVDTEGNTIAPQETDTKDASTGTSYDTSDDHKHAKIENNGKIYRLVTVAGANWDANGVQNGSDAEQGEVEKGTKTVTYVYELVKGDVFVHYENEDGEVIKDSVEAKKDTPTGDPYDTTSKELKPDEIKTPDGKTYEYKKVKEDSDPEKGEVKEDPTNVTYVYKEVKGSVVVNYVDTEGNTIAPQETDTKDASTGTSYDTSDDHKHTKIENNGKIYRLVTEAGTNWNAAGVQNGSDAEQGEVEKGTKTVTYVYELLKGNVVVHYENEDGETIKADVVDMDSEPVNADYDTFDNKPKVIKTDDGTVYYFKEVKSGDEEKEEGKVIQGTIDVTYVYRKMASWVPHIPGDPDPEDDKVKYPDPEDPEDPQNPKVPTTENPNDPGNPPVIPYVPGHEPDQPLQPVDPEDPSKGYIPPEPKSPWEDTHIYYKEAKGNVIVHYVNENGETIAVDVEDTPETLVDTEYDTTDNKPKTITKDGKTYEFKAVKSGDKETGKVVKGTTHVTYIYKLVTEAPVEPDEPNKPDQPKPNKPDQPKPEKTAEPATPQVPGEVVNTAVDASSMQALTCMVTSVGAVILASHKRRK